MNNPCWPPRPAVRVHFSQTVTNRWAYFAWQGDDLVTEDDGFSSRELAQTAAHIELSQMGLHRFRAFDDVPFAEPEAI